MQDGRAGARLDAGPTEGGGAARQWRQSLCPSLRGPARGDFDICGSGGGSCPNRIRPGGSAPLSRSGKSPDPTLFPSNRFWGALFVFNTH